MEQQSSAGGCPTIEPKDKLVEVGLQSVMSESPLMRSQQPSLQERSHAMGLGQQVVASRRRVPRDGMLEAATGQPGVTGQPVRDNITFLLDQILRHIQQGVRLGVRNHLKPRPTDHGPAEPPRPRKRGSCRAHRDHDGPA